MPDNSSSVEVFCRFRPINQKERNSGENGKLCCSFEGEVSSFLFRNACL